MIKFTLGETIAIIATFLLAAFLMWIFTQSNAVPKQNKQWNIQAIDTMKYSRDLARSGVHNSNYTKEIDKQVADIAAAGATHVAIATPYDDEFIPVLHLWVRAARAHGLQVWFRGNFSGWEGWFGYAPIDRQTHLEKTKRFILNNRTLFKDGDIFSSCPECENGPEVTFSDPTAVVSYRQFLIDEYAVTKNAFATISKNVPSNYFSMNADVAKAVMDPETTKQLDGLVVIDHYVKSPTDLANDVAMIAAQSNGKIMLGEIGAPIPDLHGKMTDQEQKEWLEESLQLLTQVDSLVGISYWVNKGGSTSIWHPDGSPTSAVEVLTKYYKKTY